MPAPESAPPATLPVALPTVQPTPAPTPPPTNPPPSDVDHQGVAAAAPPIPAPGAADVTGIHPPVAPTTTAAAEAASAAATRARKQAREALTEPALSPEQPVQHPAQETVEEVVQEGTQDLRDVLFQIAPDLRRCILERGLPGENLREDPAELARELGQDTEHTAAPSAHRRDVGVNHPLPRGLQLVGRVQAAVAHLLIITRRGGGLRIELGACDDALLAHPDRDGVECPPSDRDLVAGVLVD